MKRVPYRCPVCVGAGFVNRALYEGAASTAASNLTCRSCLGTGLVWGEETSSALEREWDSPLVGSGFVTSQPLLDTTIR